MKKPHNLLIAATVLLCMPLYSIAADQRPCPPLAFQLDGAGAKNAERNCGKQSPKQAPLTEDDHYGLQSNSYVGLPASFEKTHRVSSSSQLLTAIQKAQPGEAIVLADGNYSISNSSSGYQHWANSASGTAASSIYLIADNMHAARFTGSGNWRFDGSHLVIAGVEFTNQVRLHGDYIRFAHNRMQGSKATLGVYGDDAEIDNNIIENTKNQAIWVAQSKGTLSTGTSVKRPHIHHNEFRNIRKVDGANSEAIMLGYGYTPTAPGYDNNIEALIENNLFYRAQGDSEVISVKSDRNVIRNNCFMDGGWSTLVIRAGDENLVTGNRFAKMDSIGLRVAGHNNIVAFNHFSRSNRGRNALELHVAGVRPERVGWSWGYYAYNNAKANQITSNVFDNFAIKFRTYSIVGNFVELPIQNRIASNDFRSDSISDYLDSSHRFSWSKFANNNSVNGNKVSAAPDKALESCAQLPGSHRAGKQAISLPREYQGLESRDLAPPSWW